MGDIVRLPHIDTPDEAPIAYAEEAGTVYVFTGRLYRPNFHLLLRRRSPDGDDLEGLIDRLSEEMRVELLERYTDADDPQEWWWFSRDGAVHEAIQNAEIQTFVLNSREFRRLVDPNDALLTAPRQPPEGGDEPTTLAETRHALSAELGSILAARWTSKDGADRIYHRYSTLGTAWLALGGLGSSVGSGVTTAVNDYRELGQDAADAASAMWSATVDAIQAIPTSLEGLQALIDNAREAGTEAAQALVDYIITLAEEAVRQLAKLSWDAIRAYFERVGTRTVDSLERAVELARQGVDKLRVILRDRATLGILVDFIGGYLDSFHDDWWLNAVDAIGQVLGFVAVEALIELGLAAATAGIAAPINAARVVGTYTVRAIRYLARLYDQLIKATQRVVGQASDLAQAAKRSDIISKPKRAAPSSRPELPELSGDANYDVKKLEPGEKGDWNDKLNRAELDPNTEYKVGPYTYRTDGQGRIKRAEGQLERKSRDRSGYQQGKAGRRPKPDNENLQPGVKDGKENDQGGHLIASSLNGPGEQINLVPQDAQLNNKVWGDMEEKWRQALDEGKNVEVDIEVKYPQGSKRPKAFEVRYCIDGEKSQTTFKNEPGG